MDIDCNKCVCATCQDWQGNREFVEGGIIRVSTSAKGKCERTAKIKPAQGGCDQWTKCEGGTEGDGGTETHSGS